MNPQAWEALKFGKISFDMKKDDNKLKKELVISIALRTNSIIQDK